MFSSSPTQFLGPHNTCFSDTWVDTMTSAFQLYPFLANPFATLEPITHKNIVTVIILSLSVFKSSSTTGCHHNHSRPYFKAHSLAKPKFSSTLCVYCLLDSHFLPVSQPLPSTLFLICSWLSLLSVSFLNQKQSKKTLTTQKKIYRLLPKQPSSPLNCQ